MPQREPQAETSLPWLVSLHERVCNLATGQPTQVGAVPGAGGLSPDALKPTGVIEGKHQKPHPRAGSWRGEGGWLEKPAAK